MYLKGSPLALCYILFPDIENDAWRYYRWVGGCIKNIMFFVVTWVKMAPSNIFVEGSNPPFWKKICYLSPWNWHESLEILQLFTYVAICAKRRNFLHILHEIVFKTLKLTNMYIWNFSGTKSKEYFSCPPGKVKIFPWPPLLLPKNFRSPPFNPKKFLWHP